MAKATTAAETMRRAPRYHAWMVSNRTGARRDLGELSLADAANGSRALEQALRGLRVGRQIEWHGCHAGYGLYWRLA